MCINPSSEGVVGLDAGASHAVSSLRQARALMPGGGIPVLVSAALKTDLSLVPLRGLRRLGGRGRVRAGDHERIDDRARGEEPRRYAAADRQRLRLLCLVVLRAAQLGARLSRCQAAPVIIPALR